MNKRELLLCRDAIQEQLLGLDEEMDFILTLDDTGVEVEVYPQAFDDLKADIREHERLLDKLILEIRIA